MTARNMEETLHMDQLLISKIQIVIMVLPHGDIIQIKKQ